nr:hypothetical protein [candidate division Zixibacteria bacterium]
MKKSLVFLFVLILTLPVLVVCGQASDQKTEPAVQEKAPAEQAAAEQPSIIGEWTMLPTKMLAGGSLIIGSDGKYTRADKPIEGTASSVTGPYKLDKTATPAAIDLCVGECGGPGSEWTTLFCIYRFHTADTLEIRYSPDSKRPTDFAEKPDDNTMIFVRKPAETKMEKK